MWLSYLKIAFRNFNRQRVNALINIIGLALGIAVFFLIIQYVTFEYSYDSFNKNADNLFRVRNDRIYSDRHDESAGCPPAVAPALKKEFPEVVEAARVRGTDIIFVNLDDKSSDNIEKVFFAENSFLKMFSYPLLKGSRETALEEPYTVVISNSLSQKYFGGMNPVNQLITLINEDGEHVYNITGVFQDVPENSHIKFNMLISYSTLIAQNSDAEYYWGWNAFNTYIQLAPGTNPEALQAKFPAMIEKYKNYENSYKRQYLLQPVKDIHLHSDLRFEPEVNGNEDTVRFLTLIAVIVLLLAWINYINLSTSQSLIRAKEVGIRKVLGSNRFQLIKQFMMESFLLNFIAVILAIMIDAVALPYFNRLTGKPLALSLLLEHWTLIITMLAAGTVLSGIYPAFIMSSFKSLDMFKTKFGRMSRFDLRKGLVVFQFAAAIIFIASTIMVYRQLSYMQNEKLGADIDRIVLLKAPLAGDTYKEASYFKEALLSLPGVEGVSASASVPLACSAYQSLPEEILTRTHATIMKL